MSESDAPKKVHYAEAMRTEIAELKADKERLESEVAMLRAATAQTVTCPADVSPLPAQAVDAPSTSSDEWRFVERVIAEMEIPEGSGRVKRIYNELDARLKVWRITRDIVLKLGPGARWPQYNELGRSEGTGEIVEKKAAPVAPPPAPVMQQAPGIPQGGASQLDAYKNSIRNTLMGGGLAVGPPAPAGG